MHMSITVIISHEVEDFQRWKTGFDEHESVRTEAGIDATAYRRADAPNHAYVIATAESKEVFEAFVSNPNLQEAMKNAGVLGPPAFTILENG
jgi:quinol monooxygenase YgiN